MDIMEKNGGSSHTKSTFSINNTCSGGEESQLYNITSTDHYYFAFDDRHPHTDLRIGVSLLLQRTEYDITNISIANSCSIGSLDSCKVPVPYHSDYTTLMSVHSGPSPEANLKIEWSCDVRVWLCVLIIMVPIIFVEALSLSICCRRIYNGSCRHAGYSALD